MKIVTYIRSFGLLLLLSSCNFLNISPKDIIAPGQYYKSEAELQAALTGVYATLADGNLYKNNMIGRMGLDADLGYDIRDGDINTVSQYSVVPTDLKVTRFWQTLYAGINNANILLEHLDDPIAQLSDQKREMIRGEALFLRGYFYFLLVSNFGDVPLILKSTSSARAEDMNLPRTPAKRVYEKIIGDMEMAAEKVADIAELGYGGRISKSAVWGILARVHIYVAGYPINDVTHYKNARDCAAKVIALNFHALNPSYQQIFINYAQDVYDIKESIWEVEFKGNGVGLYATVGGYIGGNNGIRNSFDFNLGYAFDYINATKYAYNLYKTGDLRRDHCIAPFYYRNPGNNIAEKVNWSATQLFNRNCGKFRREYEVLEPKHRSYTPQNYPLLRFSDVLLMFAEADNEVNMSPSTEAFYAVNAVRRRGYGKPVNTPDATVDVSGLGYEEFKHAVWDERARELAFESLRKGDLVRWGTFIQQMKGCLADANAAPAFTDIKHAKSTYTNVSERDVLWPIPSYEMGINQSLTQNPGW